MPRIMIIHPEGNIANNPNLYGIVELLCEQGYEIDYYSRHRPHISQQLPIPHARFFPITLHDVEDTAVILPPNLQVTPDFEDKLTKTLEGYDLLIGIDRGIGEAAIIAGMLKIPYGLISYELYFAEETGNAYKLPEIDACKGISFAVCQDRLRSHHLAIENRIDADKIINIPVAGRSAVRCTANRELHKTFGLSEHTRIALYMGEVTSKWAGIDDLLSATGDWDDTWVLVLHHRYGAQLPETCDSYIQSGKVFSSPLGSLPFSEMYRLLSAVDLGIAFYLPQPGHGAPYPEGLNLEKIGMASGKIATYLQHGLPLLTNEIGEMSRHIRKEQLGAVVDDIKASAQTLSQLTPNILSGMRRNCLQFFEQHLDLNKTAKPLLDTIKRMCRHGSTSRKLSASSIGCTPDMRSAINVPKISIVTPSYNQADYLEECIDSILSQNYPNLEYIIIDGGSTDGSVEIIKKHEKHLTYWQSKSDGGHYQAVNEGFLHSTGEIMAWLNSDDKYHPGALWLVSDTFRTFPQVEWVMGSPTGWDENGKALYFSAQPPLWSREKYLRGEIGPPHIQQESTFWRRNLWQKAGGSLDTNYVFAADMELWARFFRYTQLHTLHAPIAGFRRQPNQKTAHFIDRYNHEAQQVVERERMLFQSSGLTSLQPAPAPLYVEDVVSKARSSITPSNFGFFSYSRTIHFPFFGRNDLELYGNTIDPYSCDLKAYQDLLVYTFIKQNIPAGSRILEIGGGNSRILRALRYDYECWNLDKLEGVGNGPTKINAEGFMLVRDYIGSFSPELPSGYFDLAFSISALEHVEETRENYRNICDDITRILKPDGWSLHCFDIVAKIRSTWTNGLLPYIFEHVRTANKFAPFEQIYLDPFAYAMSEESYNRYWRAVTKVSYREHGFPISYNVLWSNGDSGTLNIPATLSAANMDGYLVSAIVSTYNAEKFFLGCLQNLVDQTLYRKGQLQIVIINSGSEQDEESIAREFMGRYDHIIYRRTSRETLYAAWNRGIELARGRYITHANTDDRHCANAFELMAQELERNDVGLVYVDALMTRIANETFNKHSAEKAWLLPDFNIRQAIFDCPFGCQVMWRRSAHADVGMFDGSYKRAGDYEFFLRLALKSGAFHLPKILTLYHESPDNLSYQAPEEVIQEVNRFIGPYRRQLPLESIYPYLQKDSSSAAQAAALVDFANNLMGSNGFLFRDTLLAEALYRQALEILPRDPDIIGNLIVACLVNGTGNDAISLIQSARCLTPRLAYFQDALVHDKTPVFTLTQIDYPSLSAMQAIKTARDIRVPWDRSIVKPEIPDILRQSAPAFRFGNACNEAAALGDICHQVLEETGSNSLRTGQAKLNANTRPLRFYVYRPGVDFHLDPQRCYMLSPLLLDTTMEDACTVESNRSKWRFDTTFTHEWRKQAKLKGYWYDSGLYRTDGTPANADYFIFPYLLEEMIEVAGTDEVSSWLRRLPHYVGNERRHVFMTFHDSSERFNLESVCFRASIRRSCRDDRAVAIPYAVDDLISQTHFDPSRIRYDATFAGFVGCPVSGPVRRQVIASLAKTTRIRTFVSPAERFHGHQKDAERLERRELFLKSLAESWMVVCPRGAGVNTYRFFETLSMGRIPVLISDDCLLPFEDRIDYDAFMLRIPEKHAEHSADIIAQWLASQTTETLLVRCRLARRTWEEYFACTRWNHRIVETLRRHLNEGDEAVIVDGVIFQLQQRNPFGISRLWRSLLSELGKSSLAKRILLLDRDGTAPRIPGIKTRALPAFRIGGAKEEAVALDTVCREERAGLFISTYYTFTQETRSLLMLYDMIPERFQKVGPDAPNPEWRDKHHAIENSSSFAAISQSTACDLALFYPHAAARPQKVIPCAVSDAFRTHSTDEIAAFKAARGLKKRYFLLVGRHDAHKNMRLFFQAFARLPDREQYAIVMAGAGHEIEPELRELIAGADSYAGFFSDQDLALLYSGAVALVYPSIYEGFGLPILEAMQSGCPVITCHNSSIFEVAGRAALYVGECDVDGLSKTLLDVQQPDVRGYLITAGLEQAQRFSWKKSAVLLAATINAQL